MRNTMSLHHSLLDLFLKLWHLERVYVAVLLHVCLGRLFSNIFAF